MILAAGYLLFMFQRIVFGELSEFFTSLGDHLTDMTPVEILTLAPLAALVVAFGIQPGLLLDLFGTTVTDTIAAAKAGTPIAIPAALVLGIGLLLAAGIIARIAYVLLRPGTDGTAPVPAEGGAAH